MHRRAHFKGVAGAGVALAALCTPGLAHASAVSAARSYSPLDESMLQTSIQGDRFEIAGGKLAAKRGVTPAVRALGTRLLKDHSASLKDAIKVAHRLRISVPKTASPSEEWELQIVGSMTGTAFDGWYARLEIQDHKQDIEETKTEIAEGSNASIRHLARTDLPMLRKHLKLSKQALAAVAG